MSCCGGWSSPYCSHVDRKKRLGGLLRGFYAQVYDSRGRCFRALPHEAEPSLARTNAEPGPAAQTAVEPGLPNLVNQVMNAAAPPSGSRAQDQAQLRGTSPADLRLPTVSLYEVERARRATSVQRGTLAA